MKEDGVYKDEINDDFWNHDIDLKFECVEEAAESTVDIISPLKLAEHRESIPVSVQQSGRIHHVLLEQSDPEEQTGLR